MLTDLFFCLCTSIEGTYHCQFGKCARFPIKIDCFMTYTVQSMLMYVNIFIQQEAVENKKGVTGYRQTQEELEKVSAVKSELDEKKGKTLEDISDMVQRLTRTIATKKNSLAPIIKELRPMRQRAQVRAITRDRT